MSIHKLWAPPSEIFILVAKKELGMVHENLMHIFALFCCVYICIMLSFCSVVKRCSKEQSFYAHHKHM